MTPSSISMVEMPDEPCRAVFKGLEKIGGTPSSIPDLAPALREKYMKRNSASAVVPDVLLEGMAGDGYRVRAESLKDGMKAVIFSSGEEERCLVANRRWIEAAPRAGGRLLHRGQPYGRSHGRLASLPGYQA